jgi:hypothetical protein
MPMPKDTDNNDSPDLLNALESIKGLLEQSENKLSAARESLKKAKPAEVTQSIVRPSVSSEPVVPVLDDVIEISADAEDDEEPSQIDEVPELQSILEPEAAPSPEPLEEPQPAGHSTEEVLVYLEQLHEQLEQELSDSLMRTVVDLKAEIKKTLSEEFQKLKEQLAQTDDE